MEESPKERFKRVAENRTKKMLKEIELMGNLGDKNRYHYTQEDVDKIFSALNSAIEEARSRFTFTIKRSVDFKL